MKQSLQRRRQPLAEISRGLVWFPFAEDDPALLAFDSRGLLMATLRTFHIPNDVSRTKVPRGGVVILSRPFDSRRRRSLRAGSDGEGSNDGTIRILRSFALLRMTVESVTRRRRIRHFEIRIGRQR